MIGDYAFSLCKNLMSVTISGSTELIGEGAFEGCEKLVSLTIAEGVKTMEITYLKPLQNLLTLYNNAQNKRDAKAQFQLAEMLLRSKKPSAEKTAVEWLQKASKQGSADARFALGCCCETGTGVRKNCRQAVEWYKLVDDAIFDWFYTHKDPIEDAVREVIRQYDEDEEFAAALDEMIENDRQEDSFEADLAAAENGDAEAQNRLGHRYYYGRDVEMDREKAVYWYTRSAEQGYDAGIAHLAWHYETEKNYMEAAKWYGRYAKCRLDWFRARLRAARAE